MSLLRQILLGVGLLAALAGYYLVTQHRIDAAEARATTAETTASTLRGELANARLTERIVTEYVDRVQVVHERGATLIQKVPLYVPSKADAGCALPLGFIRLHNAAAAGGRAGAGSADAPGQATGDDPDRGTRDGQQ